MRDRLKEIEIKVTILNFIWETDIVLYILNTLFKCLWNVHENRWYLSHKEIFRWILNIRSHSDHIDSPFSSVQSLSHVRLFVTPWTAARQASLSILLPESTQTHVHWVGDAIELSNPLSSPSPSAINLSQHQGLFKWVSSLHQVAKVLEFQLQHQSFQWTPRTDLL